MYDIVRKVSKTLYPPEVVLKAAYAFLSVAYIHIEDDPAHWIIKLHPKQTNSAYPILGDEFENELLAQAVRLRVQQRTKSVREILLGRALASTMIDEVDPIVKIEAEQADVPEEELSQILTDWFEHND